MHQRPKRFAFRDRTGYKQLFKTKHKIIYIHQNFHMIIKISDNIKVVITLLMKATIKVNMLFIIWPANKKNTLISALECAMLKYINRHIFN